MGSIISWDICIVHTLCNSECAAVLAFSILVGMHSRIALDVDHRTIVNPIVSTYRQLGFVHPNI
jgi:hypothetical protein